MNTLPGTFTAVHVWCGIIGFQYQNSANVMCIFATPIITSNIKAANDEKSS
jgi:hypothetical protein